MINMNKNTKIQNFPLCEHRVIIMVEFGPKKDEELGEWRILYEIRYSIHIIRLIKRRIG